MPVRDGVRSRQRRVFAGGCRGPARPICSRAASCGWTTSGGRGRGKRSSTRSPRRCRPASFRSRRSTAEHPIYRMLFPIAKIPQVPSMQFWRMSGGATSEMDEYSANAHMAAITDKQGRIMVLMTHNTDIADSWEREGRRPAVLLQLLAERLRGRPERRALLDEPLTCQGFRHQGMTRLTPRVLRMAIVAILLAASVAVAQEQWDRIRGWRLRPQPLSAALSDRDQLRRRLQLLPVDVHQRSPRSRRLGMVHRLLGRRPQFLDAARRADQDDDQPAGRTAIRTTSRFAFPIRRCSSARS